MVIFMQRIEKKADVGTPAGVLRRPPSTYKWWGIFTLERIGSIYSK
jgi:hypothetical protein